MFEISPELRGEAEAWCMSNENQPGVGSLYCKDIVAYLTDSDS
jgi:hypothetical protein